MKIVSTTADLAGYFESKSIAAPLASMKEAGFRHIDMSMYKIIYKDSPWLLPGDGWKREVEECLSIAAREGFDFCQAHSPDGVHFKEGEERDALILATRRTIEACKMLGIPHTVIHAAGFPGATHEEFRRENIAFYKLFEEDAEKHGIDILAENSARLWNPEYYLNTGAEMRSFIAEADMPRLHICWDTGHANVEGRNQYDDIMDMGCELKAFHIQDNYGDNDSHMMPLAGTTNFDGILRGIIDSGYKGDFTFEGNSTLRRAGVWPNYRRDVKDSDKLANPPLSLQIKQISIMREIGEWMLRSYGIKAE